MLVGNGIIACVEFVDALPIASDAAIGFVSNRGFHLLFCEFEARRKFYVIRSREQTGEHRLIERDQLGHRPRFECFQNLPRQPARRTDDAIIKEALELAGDVGPIRAGFGAFVVTVTDFDFIVVAALTFIAIEGEGIERPERQIHAGEVTFDAASAEVVRSEPQRCDPRRQIRLRSFLFDLERQHAVHRDAVDGIVHVLALNRAGTIRTVLAGQRPDEYHRAAAGIATNFVRVGIGQRNRLRASFGQPFEHGVEVLLLDRLLGVEFNFLRVPAIRTLQLPNADVEFQVGSALVAGKDASFALIRQLTGAEQGRFRGQRGLVFVGCAHSWMMNEGKRIGGQVVRSWSVFQIMLRVARPRAERWAWRTRHPRPSRWSWRVTPEISSFRSFNL